MTKHLPFIAKPIPKTVALEQQTYLSIMQVRDWLVRPIVMLLVGLRIRPEALSVLGVVLMGLTAYFLAHHSLTNAAVSGVGSILADWLDGGLARYQKIASDRGKFIDMVADNLSFTLFVTGLVAGGWIVGALGVLYVYVMVLSKVFRVIWRNQYWHTNWRFRAVAGFLPNACFGLTVLAFLIAVLEGGNYLHASTLLCIGVLGVDTAVMFSKLAFSSPAPQKVA